MLTEESKAEEKNEKGEQTPEPPTENRWRRVAAQANSLASMLTLFVVAVPRWLMTRMIEVSAMISLGITESKSERGGLWVAHVAALVSVLQIGVMVAIDPEVQELRSFWLIFGISATVFIVVQVLMGIKGAKEEARIMHRFRISKEENQQKDNDEHKNKERGPVAG